MTDWVDFFTYAVLLFSLFFVYPWVLGRLSLPMLADRNSQWLAENPTTFCFIKRFGSCAFWLHIAVGVVSLVLLTMIQLGAIDDIFVSVKWLPVWTLHSSMADLDLSEKWVLLWQLSMLSILINVLFFGVLSIFWYLVWMRKIPLTERRQADIQRRSLDDFVPSAVRLITYLLVAMTLAAWVGVAILGWHDDPGFWGKLITLFILSGVFWFVTSLAINRRPNLMDRIFGMGYRRGEVRLTFACQLLPVILGTIRLYEELADVIVFNMNRGIFLCIALYVAVWILWFGYLVANKLPPRESAENILIKAQ